MRAVGARRSVMVYGWDGLVSIPYTRHRILLRQARRGGSLLGVENVADCQTFVSCLLCPWRRQRRGCWYRLELCISRRRPFRLFGGNWCTWRPPGVFAGCSLSTSFILHNPLVPLSTLDLLELSFQHIISLLVVTNRLYRLISVSCI
jgi:hypothetical protein